VGAGFGKDHAQAKIESPAPSLFGRQALRRTAMPRKPGLNSEFVMFDVLYEDGSQRSNRKVPRALTGGIDGDKPAHEFLIEQDRDIAEKSGRPPLAIKSIDRSDAKKKAWALS
jgi:hypothetical protein